MIIKFLISFSRLSLRLLKKVMSYSRFKLGKELYKLERITRVVNNNNSIFNLYDGKRPDTKVLEGTFDRAVLDLYNNMVGEGWVVVDIGSNIGLHTVHLSKLVGNNGHVYSVEPIDYNLVKLNTNLWLNNCKNVSILDCVVGDSEKKNVFINKVKVGSERLDNSSVSNNQNIRNLKSEGLIEETFVRQISIDSLSAQISNKINLIKIDVEGYEINVLKGAIKTIRSQKPILILEINPKRLKDLSVELEEYSEMICEFYDCYEVLNPNTYENFYSLEPLVRFEDKIISSDVICIPKAKFNQNF